MQKTTTTPEIGREIITKRDTFTTTTDIRLDGLNVLKAKRITTTYILKGIERGERFRIIEKEELDSVVEPLSFDLVEVTPEKLVEYRKMKIPFFVLKAEGRYYYTEIPRDLSLVSSKLLGEHQCAKLGHECNLLSAASDEKGGCEKVRDRIKFIEKYPWITTCYATYNTKYSSFVVVKCLHYEAIKKARKRK